MSIEDKLQGTKNAIEQQRSALHKIGLRSNTGKYDLALERLERWKEGATKIISSKVSPHEGKKLEERDISAIQMSSHESFTAQYKEYMIFLKALSEEGNERHEAVILDEQGTAASKSRGMPILNRSPKTVFIIHGHDEANLLKLEKLLIGRFKLEPIIIRDMSGKGRTIIQKFEEEAEKASFAIALFTPDDMTAVQGNQYTQARPNVIFELGWFYGRLGREKTCILFNSTLAIFPATR